jgi:hypothetical protein
MADEIIKAPEPTANVGVAGATEYHGNTNDLIALTAAISGLSFCGYMATNGLLCCLPVLLGIAGLAMAKDAQDPVRARNLSLIGILTAGLLLALFLACIVVYVGFIVAASLSSGSGAFDRLQMPVF